MHRYLSFFLGLLCAPLCVACNDNDALPDSNPARSWSWVATSDSAALLSVHGTSAKDVWMAGADDGKGPVVLHFVDGNWQRLDTGVRGDLWWVNATEQGPVFFAGASALLLADILSRVVIAPQELPLGIITALAGAPFFLWVLQRAKNQGFW